MSETYRIKKPATLADIPHDNHAVIEASAGTGKTYTIEHMVVDLLLSDPDIRISQILIVTFTERATHELKSRIRKLLQGIVDAAPRLLVKPYEDAWEIGVDERRRLERALSAFDTAPIHTIHGFCHRVLTENAFQNHRLFDQDHTDFDVIFERVFKRALRHEFARKPSFRPYLSAWLEAKDPAIPRLQKLLASCARSRARLLPPFDERALGETLDAFEHMDVSTVVELLRAELKEEGVHHATIRAVCKRVDGLLDTLDPWRKHGDVVPFLARAGGKKVYEYLQEKLADYAFAGPTGQKLRAAMQAVVPLEAAVAQRFLPTLNRMLREYKEEEGHFSYDDMLAFVWESLESPRGPALVENLRERYQYALIDEFQDTDDLQWKIFRRIFHESGGENIFYLIGDPKQAIYSFRGADVYTYLDAKQAVLDAGGALVRLGDNYRSSLGVVTAYNHIFDQSAEPSYFTGKITYDTPVECALADRSVTEADGSRAVPVKLAQIVDEDLNAGRLREGLAAHFAQEIRRLLEDDGLCIRETVESEPVELQASDIFVLTRSRAEGRYFAEHLRREGVPFAFFKQDGLFQTPEAVHIYDLLQGVAHPHDRSKRLKAWLTPFFGLDIDQLEAAEELAETDPLVEDLFEWKQLADRRYFESLFNDIVRRSGLIRREIFSQPSERELTNYLHIFELLLQEAHQNGYDLEELVLRLKAFIEGSATPTGEDGNVQRLETDRDAVQIMTMHKAKGLEAEVVFVYGGFGSAPWGDLYAFHDEHDEPVLHIGAPPKRYKQMCERERAEEEQRLMYVALTRAKARLYLPYVGFENDPEKRDYSINGAYAALLPRLDAICAELPEQVDHPRFELDQIEYADTIVAQNVEAQLQAIASWQPPVQLPVPHGEARFDRLRSRRHVVSSYSRIKGNRARRAEIEPEEFKADGGQPISEILAEGDLPGGKRAGVFLHALVEDLDFASVLAQPDRDAWLDDPAVDVYFRKYLREYGVSPDYLAYCKTLVWNAVTSPLVADGLDLPPVARCDDEMRELEFVYPIPEDGHPTLDELSDGELSIERGYIKGFIDLLVEVDGKVYFADWKSDILASYAPAALDAHVAERYGIQAKLYSLAVARFLDVHDEAAFEQRFGGYLYLFIRGMTGEPGRGVYYRRPSWRELLSWEKEIRGWRV